MIYIDQLHREISLSNRPQRIISLVPSQTEVLVALGLEDSIVGVTKFCVHPEHIRKENTIVGGTKKVNYDVIDVLKPDIILCNKEENTQAIVEVLSQKYPVHVSDINTMKQALEMIRQYGEIFEKEEKSSTLITRIKLEEQWFLDFIADKPKKRVAYFIWKKPWMVAGDNTFTNVMLRINGFINVFEDSSRYPEVSEEELAGRVKDLDLILLSSEPFPFSEKHVDEVQKIYKNVKVILVDGEYFSWYGSRLIDAFSYFKTLH